VGRKHQLKAAEGDLTAKEVEDLVKDAFNSAGERDIYTGDYVDMVTITAAGLTTQKFELKFD
jgi:20S proteasome subunit beta 6